LEIKKIKVRRDDFLKNIYLKNKIIDEEMYAKIKIFHIEDKRGDSEENMLIPFTENNITYYARLSSYNHEARKQVLNNMIKKQIIKSREELKYSRKDSSYIARQVSIKSLYENDILLKNEGIRVKPYLENRRKKDGVNWNILEELMSLKEVYKVLRRDIA